MTYLERIPALLVLALTLLVVPGQSPAQSRWGDLQAMIDAALPGAVLEVPFGIYAGPITIDKPLHLKGVSAEDGERPVIDGGGIGTVVTISAAGTVLEGFDIRGGGNAIDREDGGIAVHQAENVRLAGNRLTDVLYGIRGVEADGLQIIGNSISGKELHIARRGDSIRIWQSENCLIEGNSITHARDAIFWFSDNTTVRNNHFRDSRYGIHMMYTDGMTIAQNESTGNSVGAYLMYSSNVQIRDNTFSKNRGPSGYGLALKDMDGVTVIDNYYIDNRVGIFFDNSPSRVDITQAIERNVLAFNDIGVLMMPAVRHNVLRSNSFLDNLEQVGVKGGGSNPGDALGANDWDGNYWSDYVGYDATDDGIGDLAYHADSLFEKLADQHPALGLLHFSPVQQAIDLAAQAFPIIKPKPKLTDRTPRMAPLLPRAPSVAGPPPRAMGLLSVLLLAGALSLYWSRRPKLTSAAGAPLPPSTGSGGVESGPPCRRDRQEMSKDALTTFDHPSDPTLAGADAVLVVSRLCKRYPQPGRAWWSDATITAVDELSFTLARGQALALWGVNGAGKTTVLKCLLGLLACEGELWLNGTDLRADGRRARRSLGYVPQELAFHNDLSVIESCRFYARLKDVPVDRIPGVLHNVGLAGQERKAVGALSGGMKQRLALGLALLSDPPVLLLDEPTSNLDAETRAEFLQMLAELRHAGKTLLFTSHHLEEVEQLADRVLILRDGMVVADGAPAALQGLLHPPHRTGHRDPHPAAAVPGVTAADNESTVFA